MILLADDLGWQDVKCYDIDEPSPMETPNLDALAMKGVKFWQGYSPSPVCSPSRAAILSGHHPVRGEMTSVAGGFPPHPTHPTRSAIMSPWYSSRIPTSTVTIAEALKAEGYTTGHSGKWHVSHNHHAYPNQFDHGFDYSVSDRGVQANMIPDRLTGFSTRDPDDPYRLDENGFPRDAPQEGALTFLRENKDKPFFLYYATWLVHAPLVMRSEALLKKYVDKLGVELRPEHATGWTRPGQTNPFYCAMVEQYDYYMGQVIDYLETTDDPRWPGHKLIENTYIIFTSDNGGMEGEPTEIYTDNYPLDRGKISVKEGGVRVPLIITGPGIPAGVETDVMANGLDFYPTILSLVGAAKPEGNTLDGCDLVPLLTGDPTDPTLVRDAQGRVRDTMFWHFPQSENSSSIRNGDYKLLRRYGGLNTSLELYRLYRSEEAGPVREDIEEMKDLAASQAKRVEELDKRLAELISQSGGRLPYLNPKSAHDLPNKKNVPSVLECSKSGQTVEVRYREKGAKVVLVDLVYAVRGGERDEEWLRVSADITGEGRAVGQLPPEATHYFINLVDEHHFLVSYPEINAIKRKEKGLPFSAYALVAGKP